MRKLVIIIATIVPFYYSSQIRVKEKHLLGAWYACNANETYYNADTVFLTSIPPVNNCCKEVVWWLKKRNFRKYDNNCSDKFRKKDTSRDYDGNYSLLFSKEKPYLSLFQNKVLREKFEIVGLENQTYSESKDYRVLVLKRLPLL